MSKSQPSVGRGELEILKVLWDVGPATVREVQDALGARGRKLAYTTVQTVLNRLVGKELAADQRGELAIRYRARVVREKFLKKRLGGLLGDLYEEATGPLVLDLLKEGKLSDAELDELSNVVKDLAAQRRTGKGKK